MNTKNFDPYDFSKKEIDGVPVYYKNLPWAPCIHIRIVFNTGAFNDPIGKEGLSHFLEHMWGDGCPSLTDKKAIREWSKIYTLNSKNAWTNFYNTAYTSKCLPDKYNEVLRVMRDMIFNSYFRAEDVEHERKVIMQESWDRFLNDKYLSYIRNLMKNIYQGHDHSRIASALGWPETIAKISAEDIKAWHKKNYGIGNFFIILTGAIEEKHIEDLKIFIKDLPKVSKQPNAIGKIDKTQQKSFIKTADEIGVMREQVEISMVRIAEVLPIEKKEISLMAKKLIYDVLHERLRVEHSLCYSVNSGGYTNKTYTEMFMNVKTEEKNIDLVKKEFKNIIDEIVNGKFVDKFNVLKRTYLEQLKASEFFSGDIADSALYEVHRYDGHIITIQEQIEEAEKVAYENVADFIKWAYDPEYIYTEIILPSKKHKSYKPLAFLLKIWHSLFINNLTN